MSRRRATRPLIRYSLWPLRYRRRLTTTSPGFATIGDFSVFFLFLARKLDSAGAGVASACVSAAAGSDGSGEAVVSRESVYTGWGVGISALSGAGPEASAGLEASRTKRAASASSGSSMVRVTSARPMGARLVVLLKLQWAMRLRR